MVVTRPRPVLVTGVPRSGTTWLARLLALSPGSCMTGREPMNPRGRQFALAGTLSGWTRLDAPTPGQRRALRRTYRGWEPRTYSRFGTRQWAGPLPWSRVVVKDPFALLSVPTVVETTDALPVLVYRHPGAVLASYRRMGWRADVDELHRLLPQTVPAGDAGDDVAAMGRFWAWSHQLFLDGQPDDAVVVDHGALARAGVAGVRRLVDRCGLPWGGRLVREVRGWGGREARGEAPTGVLHDFGRSPDAVADSWRAHLGADEVDRLERMTGAVHAALRELSVPRAA
ncbi:MAG: sulfotransferase [Streptosporangiales bacterium]